MTYTYIELDIKDKHGHISNQKMKVGSNDLTVISKLAREFLHKHGWKAVRVGVGQNTSIWITE